MSLEFAVDPEKKAAVTLDADMGRPRIFNHSQNFLTSYVAAMDDDIGRQQNNFPPSRIFPSAVLPIRKQRARTPL